MKSIFSTVALAFVAMAAFAQQTAEYNIKGTCAADVKKGIYRQSVGAWQSGFMR